MAKPEFSETQFVFGYLSEMYIRQVQKPKSFPAWEYFMFPSTLMEKDIPFDFLADFYGHSVFYQFKRSEHLKRSGAREIKKGVPASYLDYYRFKIYNNTSVTHQGQFEKIIALAKMFPNDIVCYCAPCFHTEFDFHYHFNNKTIIANSIIINCHQFNHVKFQKPKFDINDGNDHYMVYKLGYTMGYLCSKAIEINIDDPNVCYERFNDIKDKKSLLTTINTLYEDFYLNDTLKINTLRRITDKSSERVQIVAHYLLQYYNIVWQPIFSKI